MEPTDQLPKISHHGAGPTQREILERREVLEASGGEAAGAARKAFEAAVGAELQSLRELCGEQGHVMAASPNLYDFSKRRQCVFCRAGENTAEAS